MSLNVVSEYVDFTKDSFHILTKKIMGKHYDNNLFFQYMDTYVNVRYYNQMVKVRSSLEANLNYYLNEVYHKEESKVSQFIFLLFKMYYYLDDVKKFDYDKDLKDFVSEVVDIREHKVGIVDKDFKLELKKYILSIRDRKIKYINSFDNKDFNLEFSRVKNDCYYVYVQNDIAIPKLYSGYAIRKVWNSTIISENAFQVGLYLLCQKILKDIISGNFQNNYLIDFKCSLFSKKEKSRRILDIVRNDICMGCISFNITYEEFLENKEVVLQYIHDGIAFNVIIDDHFLKDKSYDTLDLFQYIIVLDDKYKKDRFIGKDNVVVM